MLSKSMSMRDWFYFYLCWNKTQQINLANAKCTSDPYVKLCTPSFNTLLFMSFTTNCITNLELLWSSTKQKNTRFCGWSIPLSVPMFYSSVSEHRVVMNLKVQWSTQFHQTQTLWSSWTISGEQLQFGVRQVRWSSFFGAFMCSLGQLVEYL